MWFSPRTLSYLAIMLGLMGAQAIAYQLSFASTSETFVTVPHAFYSLLFSGFYQQPFDYEAVDARPMLTILSLLWPINFLIFASGYIAVLSDVWASVEAAAKKAWRQGVVTQLQDALKWAENPELRNIRQRVSQSGLCCICVRQSAATSGQSPAPVALCAMLQAQLAAALLRNKRSEHASVKLTRERVHFLFDAGVPALLLAIVYVLRSVIDSLRWLNRFVRGKSTVTADSASLTTQPPASPAPTTQFENVAELQSVLDKVTRLSAAQD